MNRTVLIAVAAVAVLLILWFAFTGPSPDQPVAETDPAVAPAPGAPGTDVAQPEPPATEQGEDDLASPAN